MNAIALILGWSLMIAGGLSLAIFMWWAAIEYIGKVLGWSWHLYEWRREVLRRGRAH